jgi:Cu/Ag efflux pump CusA
VIGLAAGLMVLGFTQLTKMPADVLPEIAAPVVEVQTESLGLSAPEVEQLITVPLEQDLLNGVMGVQDIRSHSLAGLSSVQLRFEPGTDLIRARALVQERLTQAFALPNVSKPPQMLQPVSSTGRVLMIGLASAKLSPVELSVLARWTIRPRLMGLPGVANVAIFGQLDRQLQVLVDPERLRARHVTLAQVISTAGNSQLVSPLSFLEASTPGTGGFIDGPNQRLSVRHVLPFGVPADLAQVPVEGVRGTPLRLGDVATVVAGHQPMIGDAAWGGRPGLVLVVQKLPGASTPAVTRAVDRALAQLRPGLPAVQINASLFRPATYLEHGFDNLELALAWSTCSATASTRSSSSGS